MTKAQDKAAMKAVATKEAAKAVAARKRADLRFERRAGERLSRGVWFSALEIWRMRKAELLQGIFNTDPDDNVFDEDRRRPAFIMEGMWVSASISWGGGTFDGPKAHELSDTYSDHDRAAIAASNAEPWVNVYCQGHMDWEPSMLSVYQAKRLGKAILTACKRAEAETAINRARAAA